MATFAQEKTSDYIFKQSGNKYVLSIKNYWELLQLCKISA